VTSLIFICCSNEGLRQALKLLDDAASTEELRLHQDGPSHKQPGWGSFRTGRNVDDEGLEEEYGEQDGEYDDDIPRGGATRRKKVFFNTAGRRKRARPDLSSGYVQAQIRRAVAEDVEWQETAADEETSGVVEDGKKRRWPGWVTARIYLCCCTLLADATATERKILVSTTLPVLQSR
jgi:hypothetical protein